MREGGGAREETCAEALIAWERALDVVDGCGRMEARAGASAAAAALRRASGGWASASGGDEGAARVIRALARGVMRRGVGARSRRARSRMAEAAAAARGRGTAGAETWRALLDCVPEAPIEARDVLAEASPNARVGGGRRDWTLSVGAALANAARGDVARTRELFSVVDEHLGGTAGERVVGLTLLQAALESGELFVEIDDVVLAVHKALTAVSGAPVENGFACASVGMRCVCAAARHLRVEDVRTLRNSWLEPRLRAQGFSWSAAGGGNSRATLSLIEYLKIPRDERLGATAMSAFLTADLDLVGYVDGQEFKQKVIHGVVDLESPAFRSLSASERSVGKTVAAAVIATQMNLIYTLYVAPGEEQGADDALVRVARESGRILCGKAFDLLRIERENVAQWAENEYVKVEELTAEAHSSTILGVLSYSLTNDALDIAESDRLKLISWCCDKLSDDFAEATDESMRATISSGCIGVLLRLAESSEEPMTANTCMRCVSVLMDLIASPEILYEFVQCIAFKTPSLDLLGVEDKTEEDRRTSYVVAALNWTVNRARSAITVSQTDEVLSLFKRLFKLLPKTEQESWLEHFTDVYAGAALFVGQMEKDISVDTDRVLADAAAQNCVESFEVTSGETSKKKPEWLRNLQTRARWLEEAFSALGEDAIVRAQFMADLVAIASKSVEFGTKGSADPSRDMSHWPYKAERPLVLPRFPLGPGGILAVLATVFKFIEAELDLRCASVESGLETTLIECEGLTRMFTTTMTASTAAGVAMKTPGGVTAGRISASAARALFTLAKCVTQVNFTVRSSDVAFKNADRNLIALAKNLLESSNEMERSKALDAAPGVHRRQFAASRAALARALSLTDPDTEDIKFELDKIRKRPHSKRWTERHAPPRPPPRVARPSATAFVASEAQPDDFIDEDGVSILEAFEPSTDEESDSEENDEDAFIVRGMTEWD